MTTAVKQHCPYCADAAPDGGVHDCPTCGAPHHEDCWRENGGCAVFGCASAPRPDAQTVVLPTVPPEWTEDVPRRRSRSRGVLMAGGVVLLLIALAAAGGGAALMLRDSNKTEVAAGGPTEDAKGTSEPAAAVKALTAATRTTAPPSPVERVEYKTYVPSTEGYYYAAQIPSGPDWSDPSESFPTGGALLRTTVSGPDGSTLIIDRTPYDVPQLGGSYNSMQTVPHPTFGSATEYVFSTSELLPECNGQSCVDYLVADGQGGGWGVLVSGPDLNKGKQIARKVMESVSLADV